MQRFSPPKSAAVLALAFALAAGLAGWMRSMEREVTRRATLDGTDPGTFPPRPVAEVVSAVAAMKLITVQIDTHVEVASTDTSWRGDVAAKVKVPVRLHYGTDLAAIDASGIAYSPLRGMYILRIPRPTRLSTEIIGAESSEVETGWLRLRSRAGEYHLGLARKAVADQARRMTLSDADADKVQSTTREQVASLVRSIVGERAMVHVLFKDGPES